MKKLIMSLGLVVLSAPAFAQSQGTALDMSALNTLMSNQTCFAQDAAGRWYPHGSPGEALRICYARTRVGGCYFWGCYRNTEEDSN